MSSESMYVSLDDLTVGSIRGAGSAEARAATVLASAAARARQVLARAHQALSTGSSIDPPERQSVGSTDSSAAEQAPRAPLAAIPPWRLDLWPTGRANSRRIAEMFQPDLPALPGFTDRFQDRVLDDLIQDQVISDADEWPRADTPFTPTEPMWLEEAQGFGAKELPYIPSEHSMQPQTCPLLSRGGASVNIGVLYAAMPVERALNELTRVE